MNPHFVLPFHPSDVTNTFVILHAMIKWMKRSQRYGPFLTKFVKKDIQHAFHMKMALFNVIAYLTFSWTVMPT